MQKIKTQTSRFPPHSKAGEVAGSVTWEVALPMGRSEVLSEEVVFGQRPERVEKARLAEMGPCHPGRGNIK